MYGCSSGTTVAPCDGQLLLGLCQGPVAGRLLSSPSLTNASTYRICRFGGHSPAWRALEGAAVAAGPKSGSPAAGSSIRVTVPYSCSEWIVADVFDCARVEATLLNCSRPEALSLAPPVSEEVPKEESRCGEGCVD